MANFTPIDLLKYLNPFQSDASSRELERRLGISGSIGSVSAQRPAPAPGGFGTLSGNPGFSPGSDLQQAGAMQEELASAGRSRNPMLILSALINGATYFGQNPGGITDIGPPSYTVTKPRVGPNYRTARPRAATPRAARGPASRTTAPVPPPPTPSVSRFEQLQDPALSRHMTPAEYELLMRASDRNPDLEETLRGINVLGNQAEFQAEHWGTPTTTKFPSAINAYQTTGETNIGLPSGVSAKVPYDASAGVKLGTVLRMARNAAASPRMNYQYAKTPEEVMMNLTPEVRKDLESKQLDMNRAAVLAGLSYIPPRVRNQLLGVTTEYVKSVPDAHAYYQGRTRTVGVPRNIPVGPETVYHEGIHLTQDLRGRTSFDIRLDRLEEMLTTGQLSHVPGADMAAFEIVNRGRYSLGRTASTIEVLPWYRSQRLALDNIPTPRRDTEHKTFLVEPSQFNQSRVQLTPTPDRPLNVPATKRAPEGSVAIIAPAAYDFWGAPRPVRRSETNLDWVRHTLNQFQRPGAK